MDNISPKTKKYMARRQASSEQLLRTLNIIAKARAKQKAQFAVTKSIKRNEKKQLEHAQSVLKRMIKEQARELRELENRHLMMMLPAAAAVYRLKKRLGK